MVHSYCRSNPSCADTNEVTTIVEKIRSRIGDAKCSVDDDRDATKVDNIVLTLKALANIGNVETIVDMLNQCAQHKTNPIEIRLAAIEALRRQPCSNKHRQSTIWPMFNDRNEMVELRIVAFVQLMQCPSQQLVEDVVERLSTETVNQGK